MKRLAPGSGRSRSRSLGRLVLLAPDADPGWRRPKARDVERPRDGRDPSSTSLGFARYRRPGWLSLDRVAEAGAIRQRPVSGPTCDFLDPAGRGHSPRSGPSRTSSAFADRWLSTRASSVPAVHPRDAYVDAEGATGSYRRSCSTLVERMRVGPLGLRSSEPGLTSPDGPATEYLRRHRPATGIVHGLGCRASSSQVAGPLASDATSSGRRPRRRPARRPRRAAGRRGPCRPAGRRSISTVRMRPSTSTRSPGDGTPPIR